MRHEAARLREQGPLQMQKYMQTQKSRRDADATRDNYERKSIGKIALLRRAALCDDVDWMVLEPSVAGYGTGLASILYYAVLRLDNLGRCVDDAGDAGDAGDSRVCSNGRARSCSKARRRVAGRADGFARLSGRGAKGPFQYGTAYARAANDAILSGTKVMIRAARVRFLERQSACCQ
jgi:hypothetical protein